LSRSIKYLPVIGASRAGYVLGDLGNATVSRLIEISRQIGKGNAVVQPGE